MPQSSWISRQTTRTLRPSAAALDASLSHQNRVGCPDRFQHEGAPIAGRDGIVALPLCLRRLAEGPCSRQRHLLLHQGGEHLLEPGLALVARPRHAELTNEQRLDRMEGMVKNANSQVTAWDEAQRIGISRTLTGPAHPKRRRPRARDVLSYRPVFLVRTRVGSAARCIVF